MTVAPGRAPAFALVGLASGALFGAGLVVGGMTLPSKVRGFLDFAGAWDPTLMGVMGGAILVHVVAVRIARGRVSPRFAARFAWPSRRDVDARLLVGAAIFGVGWGLGGYCPGPAVGSLVSGAPSVVAFVASMLAGLALVDRIDAWRAAGTARAKDGATIDPGGDDSPTDGADGPAPAPHGTT